MKIVQNLFWKYNIDAIDGRKFNQDPLENFYSRIRARNSNKNNPNLFEFSQLYAKLISIKLLFSSKFSNCEDDNDEILAVDWSAVLECNTDSNKNVDNTNTRISEAVPSVSGHNAQLLANQNEFHSGEIIDILDVATAYFTGYCVYKLLINLKDPCLKCMMDMVEENPDCSDLRLILFKFKQFEECRDLIKPSKHFNELCQSHIEIFTSIFKKSPHNKNIKQYIKDKCIEHTHLLDPDWFDSTNSCYSHRVQVLDFMILVLLRKNCKWMDKEHVKRTTTKIRKINTVLNA